MNADNLVYFDNHATTKVDERVLEKMLPFFSLEYGNAASQHAKGWDAEEAVEEARIQVAKLIGAKPHEIVFTSGATESNNLALKGLAQTTKKRHLITTKVEHKCILETAKHLQEEGFSVTFLPVETDGRVDRETLKKALQKDTFLVSIMTANNEIGSINNLEEIGKICAEAGVVFHTDAAQALGKVAITVQEQNIDLLSGSAHKFYGPKGVGFLYVREGITLSAQMLGGRQESGHRSGTLNVPGIVGLGEAARICREQFAQDFWQAFTLRNLLHTLLKAKIPSYRVNGTKIEEDEQRGENFSESDEERSTAVASRTLHRLPHNLNFSLGPIAATDVFRKTKNICMSTGSACTSTVIEPSHVLSAIGLSDREIETSLRIGLGRFTTEEEVQYVAKRLVEVARSCQTL